MSRVLLVFILEVICGIQKFSALLAQSVDRLDLNSQLEIFKKCSVNVVVNHAELYKKDEFIGSYEIVPYNFPVILSFIRYNSTKKKRGKGLYCDNKKMKLVPNQGFHFYAPPAPKSYCFVQVYIAPKTCQKVWRPKVGTIPVSRKVIHLLFPDSFLNPIFDLRTNMTEEYADAFRLEKGNLLFIYVQRKPYECPEYAECIFPLVDFLWTYPYENSVNGVLPTKIIFEVERSSKEGFGIVTTLLFWNAPELVTYSNLKGTTSWKQLEAYRSKCRQNVLVTMLKHTTVTTDQLYLSDLTNQIKAANDSIQVEPFLVQLLCTNCTIISNMESQVSDLRIFPTFDLLVSPFPQTQFSVTTDSNHVHFVTCSLTEKEGYLSLLGYVSAFDGRTWITGFVASVISGRLWYRYAKLPTSKVNRNRDKWFQAFFVYNVLLAQGTSAISKMRWITGSWIITGIVLTYFYQGDNINRLMAPLSKSKLESFDEMLAENLTIYSPFVNIAEYEAELNKFISLGGNGIISEESMANNSYDFAELNTVFGVLFYIKNVRISYKEVISILSRITQTPHSLLEIIPTLDFDYFVNKVSKCDKHAYVDTLDKVERMKLQLKKHGIGGKRTTVSNHAYGQMINDWKFRGNPWPLDWFTLKLSTRNKLLNELGIRYQAAKVVLVHEKFVEAIEITQQTGRFL
ncbi:unnamed protein product [Orchesella dallaii]|uniref:Uncharacterized protein n=1 Tax=Orchesella dallaii TaxID=48710 RepID=A0ABP1RU62_9HEXA